MRYFDGGERLRALFGTCLGGFVALSVLASGAAAFTEPGITGNWTDFANCPANLIALNNGPCVHSYTTGGVVQIGHSSVPISIPGDTFDAGLAAYEGEPHGEEGTLCALFGGTDCVVAPPHGILNGPAQPVPGGLLGTVGNVQLTGVSAKLEWATPVPPDTAFGRDTVCGTNPFVTFDFCKLLGGKAGTAVTLSVKIHLMSPFLGSACFIGSATSPIVIPLTTGITNPPPPATPIHGKAFEFIEVRVAATQLFGTTLVSNSFSVPVANGCGTSGGGLINASINHKLGLPSAAGQNKIVITANGEERGGREIIEHGWTGE